MFIKQRASNVDSRHHYKDSRTISTIVFSSSSRSSDVVCNQFVTRFACTDCHKKDTDKNAGTKNSFLRFICCLVTLIRISIEAVQLRMGHALPQEFRGAIIADFLECSLKSSENVARQTAGQRNSFHAKAGKSVDVQGG